MKDLTKKKYCTHNVTFPPNYFWILSFLNICIQCYILKCGTFFNNATKIRCNLKSIKCFVWFDEKWDLRVLFHRRWICVTHEHERWRYCMSKIFYMFVNASCRMSLSNVRFSIPLRLAHTALGMPDSAFDISWKVNIISRCWGSDENWWWCTPTPYNSHVPPHTPPHVEGENTHYFSCSTHKNFQTTQTLPTF